MVRLIGSAISLLVMVFSCFNSRDGAIDSPEGYTPDDQTIVSIPEMVRLIEQAAPCLCFAIPRFNSRDGAIDRIS